jgi:hypothetical protein
MTTDTTLQEQLIEARAKIAVLVGPLFLAFVTLGVLIVWKTTSNPTTVAPHLDIILVAFSIFSNPVSAAAGVITGLLVDAEKGKKNNET